MQVFITGIGRKKMPTHRLEERPLWSGLGLESKKLPAQGRTSKGESRKGCRGMTFSSTPPRPLSYGITNVRKTAADQGIGLRLCGYLALPRL